MLKRCMSSIRQYTEKKNIPSNPKEAVDLSRGDTKRIMASYIREDSNAMVILRIISRSRTQKLLTKLRPSTREEIVTINDIEAKALTPRVATVIERHRTMMMRIIKKRRIPIRDRQSKENIQRLNGPSMNSQDITADSKKKNGQKKKKSSPRPSKNLNSNALRPALIMVSLRNKFLRLFRQKSLRS